MYSRSRGLHGPDFFVRAQPGPHGYNLGPVRPEVKIRPEHGLARKRNRNLGPSSTQSEREIEISARARPETKYKISARAQPGNFFFRFRPRQLGLSDFKANPFS